MTRHRSLAPRTGARVSLLPIRALGLGSLGLGGLAIAGAAQAQVPPPALPSQGDISRDRVTLPPVEAPHFDLRIQAPDRSAVPKAVDAIEFQLNTIVVDGATAFPPDEINAFFAAIKGKKVGLGVVRDAADALEQHYRAHGYFLTRVFIPPQQIDNETMKVTVVEGYIEDITVEGLDERTRHAVKAALTPLLQHKPIDLPSLERRLLILNDIPGISGTSVLRPGDTLGGSSLIVTLEALKNSYQLGVNNTSSRLLGPWGYSLNADFSRPFSLPGTFDVGLSAGGRSLQSIQSITGRYSVGIGNDGLIASFGVLAAKARPGGSVRSLNILNNLLTVSASARYPLVRSRQLSLFAEGGFTVNRSDTDILGQRLISDQTTVGNIGLTLQQNGWLAGSTTVSTGVFHGLPILGAMDRSAPSPSVLDFDPQFTRVTYAVQRVQKLVGNWTALVSLQGQYTDSKLLSGELVSFGGTAIGRGFDPSAITGDRGFGGLLELRYDLSLPSFWAPHAQLYGFTDGGETTSIATATVPESSQSIRSSGVGVRFYHRHGSIDFQAAYAHRKLGSADDRANPRALITGTFLY